MIYLLFINREVVDSRDIINIEFDEFINNNSVKAKIEYYSTSGNIKEGFYIFSDSSWNVVTEEEKVKKKEYIRKVIFEELRS